MHPNPIEGEEMSQEQEEALNSNAPSRILRDINRKKRVILVIVGDASIHVSHPKITLSDPDDLLRVAVELSRHSLAVVQVSSDMLIPLHSFSEIVRARIYAITDLPDLQVHPTDQLLLNRYEPVSYHELAMVFDHLKEMQNNLEEIDVLKLT